MLVVTRKPGEVISIGGGAVVVRVLWIKGNVVSVGIEASRDIEILRGELESRKADGLVVRRGVAVAGSSPPATKSADGSGGHGILPVVGDPSRAVVGAPSRTVGGQLEV